MEENQGEAMTDEQLRLKFDNLSEKTMQQTDKDLLDQLDVIVALLNHMKQTRGDVDHRGIAIAITHVQTAQLWIKDAVRVVN